MKRFYPDFESIQLFTLSLGYHADQLECVFCLKRDQFVSHGIVYKQRSSQLAEKVGKRIFCSNRYGRVGCGRTFQLYVASEFPGFRYNAAHLFVFISSLLAKASVNQAYFSATGQSSSRHAWRWLNKLEFQISAMRSFLRFRFELSDGEFQSKTKRLRVLLSTLLQLTLHFNNNPCRNYQVTVQKAFI